LKFQTEIIDFFLPRFCPSCKTKLSASETFVCLSCLNNIQRASQDRVQLEFNRKFKDQKFISGFISLFVFEKDKELQQIIHSLKYNGRFLLGTFLGQEAGKNLKDKIQSWEIDLILPIPLHQLKKAERGYNQSFYIAKGLSKQTGISIGKRIIKRRKYTQSQTTMNLMERQKNIREAFEVKNKRAIEGKNILLIDDVITTGATIAECGRVLLQSGAAKIYAASVAIAD
jgi:ComF family protein